MIESQPDYGENQIYNYQILRLIFMAHLSRCIMCAEYILTKI